MHGKELSYNNLVDLDAAWQLILEFDAPASAIIKHTNPCGCAEGATLAESYRRAFEADPISAYGGVLAFNREVDGETAAEIAKTFIEAIAAPGYSARALEILGPRKNLRLLRVAAAPPDLVVKSISGGFLAQTPDVHRLSRAEIQVKTKRAPTEEEWAALEFGWKICKHVKSNAIVYARAGTAGQRGRGADEPRGFGEIRRDEGSAAAAWNGARLGRLFPVPRRRRGSGGARHHRGDSTRRIGAR